jgi:zinc transporter 5/7
LQVLQLEGVVGVQETHFWTLCSNYYVGCLKLEVAADADPKYVISHTQMIFRAAGLTQLFVQLDYEFSKNTYQNLQKFY